VGTRGLERRKSGEHHPEGKIRLMTTIRNPCCLFDRSLPAGCPWATGGTRACQDAHPERLRAMAGTRTQRCNDGVRKPGVRNEELRPVDRTGAVLRSKTARSMSTGRMRRGAGGNGRVVSLWCRCGRGSVPRRTYPTRPRSSDGGKWIQSSAEDANEYPVRQDRRKPQLSTAAHNVLTRPLSCLDAYRTVLLD
jgi:hypothetical protein